MKCPNCNAENAEGMKFCGECGAQMPEQKTGETLVNFPIEEYVKNRGGLLFIYSILTVSRSVSKAKIEKYCPERKELFAPCSGEVRYGAVKPLLGGEKKVSRIGNCGFFIGTKVKKGELIGYEQLMPEIDSTWERICVSDPDIKDQDYSFEMSHDAICTSTEINDYFTFVKKDEVIAFDAARNIQIKAPADGFISYVGKIDNPFIASVYKSRVCHFKKYTNPTK